ncbi:hydantoinase B/oxoprolinase family protein [Albimonas sp. CAU 1670]|uniref:hydantoinase B/oxoprolinase family protein n=1 Tax=Albimonas sp. CAU 1670 TaxID=3032599 RepID=UPI0023DB77ED|nr:hydantoinase B/oxoprolinase family protein [Albimonas sp. CAU 1670]MDF2230974.1 hydantoinase B/oxoprolinase family protein [Albimonas sp. CAU 1670]
MDMVSLNIVGGILVSICRDMGVTLMRTSYSTIFSESLDFTCGLALPTGELVATGDFCPSMIGGMPLLLRSCVQEIDIEDLEPGDVIVHNDPYRGGLHTPEHTFFKPVFVDGALIGFSVAIGHVAEVGGMAPAGFPGEATEIFHEGLRVPPVKIKRAGKDNEDVWRLMLANVRTPRFNYGDYRAMIAAVDLGERRMADLAKKHGVEGFREHVAALMDYSERRMRAEIAEIPDGTYTFHDWMEDDGIEDKPYKINVTVHVKGDGLIVDYYGSDLQAKGPINATLGVAWGAAYNAVLQLTDASIPKNSGCFRPIKVIAPPSTVVNVDYPGPCVGGNTETHCRIANTVMGALAPALKERSAATDGASHSNFLFGGTDPDTGEFFCCYDLTPVGWGGRAFADGNDAVGGINGNCPHIPVEVFEYRFPFHVEEFKLVEGSGGAGKHRGGHSISKTLTAQADMTYSYMSDRQKKSPWGIHGGKDGGRAELLMVTPASAGEWKTVTELYGKPSPSKFANVPIAKGDRIRISSPGGGGWGDPGERDRQAVIDDILDGWITEEEAKATYGIGLAPVAAEPA